eukprot:1840593-Rhodomonas_salina.3
MSDFEGASGPRCLGLRAGWGLCQSSIDVAFPREQSEGGLTKHERMLRPRAVNALQVIADPACFCVVFAHIGASS